MQLPRRSDTATKVTTDRHIDAIGGDLLAVRLLKGAHALAKQTARQARHPEKRPGAQTCVDGTRDNGENKRKKGERDRIRE